MAVALHDGSNLNQLAAIDASGNQAVSLAGAPALSAEVISASGALTLIKTGAGKLYGLFFLNGGTASWIQFFDSATTGGVTLGVTVPVWAAPIAASGVLIIPPAVMALLSFVNGIVYAATSSLGGATTESNSGTIEYQ